MEIIRKKFILGLLAFFAVAWSSVYGQTDNVAIYRYRRDPGNGLENGVWSSSNRTVHPLVNTMFPEATTNRDRWTALLNSGYIMGSGTTLTRGQDISEDWDINFINPADGNAKNHYYMLLEAVGGDGVIITRPTTFTGGYRAGESLLNNNNVLAVGDERILCFDQEDGSLSYYSYGDGSLISPTDKANTWTAFTGGDWDGLLLSSKLNLFIGFESGLFFLDGDSHVYQYNLRGEYVRDYELSLDISGAPEGLKDYTLGQVVDGLADGYTYAGWDDGPIILGVGSGIPEPSEFSVLLGVFAVTSCFTRRRRQK